MRRLKLECSRGWGPLSPSLKESPLDSTGTSQGFSLLPDHTPLVLFLSLHPWPCFNLHPVPMSLCVRPAPASARTLSLPSMGCQQGGLQSTQNTSFPVKSRGAGEVPKGVPVWGAGREGPWAPSSAATREAQLSICFT